jgi:hypothetical protein
MARICQTRILAPTLAVTALPAFAHDGFHPHPHGIELGWVIAALVGVAAGYALSWYRGRK